MDAVLTSSGRPLFWKEKAKVQRMLAKWTAALAVALLVGVALVWATRSLRGVVRPAGWSALGLTLFGLVIQALVLPWPDIVGPMWHSGVGQALLLVAAVMVATGSYVIQKIIEIEI